LNFMIRKVINADHGKFRKTSKKRARGHC
jgi:hypothetical protein